MELSFKFCAFSLKRKSYVSRNQPSANAIEASLLAHQNFKVGKYFILCLNKK